MVQARRNSESDILAHLVAKKSQQVQEASSGHRADTGGLVLNKPPTGPNASLEDMLAAEAMVEAAGASSAQITVSDPVEAATWTLVSQRKKIRLDFIDDSPYQPRIEYDPEEIDELAHTMAAGGQADPIKVRQVGNRFELISGHRRTRAARSLGWTDIEAIIEIRTDQEAEIETMLLVVANAKLSDYEFAKMCTRAFAQNYVKTQESAAHFFGCKQPKISGCLRMLSLPSAIIEQLERKPRLLNYTHAKVISDILTTNPEHENVVIQGVEKLSEGMKQASLKGWIKQMLVQKLGKTSKEKGKVITKRGTPIYATKVAPRAVTIQLKRPSMDLAAFEARLNTFLENDANTHTEEI
ncbi:ParB/RepB/Spo0J family partition protein [Oxalobacteraceae bacterium GrIS 1.11]